MRASDCQAPSIEDRVRQSDVVLSATCEQYSSENDALTGTCTQAKIWRVIKGSSLLGKIKGKTQVTTYTLFTISFIEFVLLNNFKINIKFD